MRVLFFDIDSLRADHLGCYGYDRPTSPTIDRLAVGGTRFDRYYCATSPCMPSRAAWLTGQFGIHNGVVANRGVGAQFRMKQSFARRDGQYLGDIVHVPEVLPRHLRLHGYDSITISNFPDRHHAEWFLNGWTETQSVNLKGGREQAVDVADKALRWLRSNQDREDYLLHINFWDVHRCYNVDEKWADRFASHPVTQSWPDEDAIASHQSYRGLFTANEQFKDGISQFPLMPDAINTWADFEKLLTGYDAAIACVDHHIQLILNELETQGILDETAIIISADHGDAFGEHGIYGDHVTADECIQRIPLIIHWPDSEYVGACDEFLYNTDFYPTLCSLLGLPMPEQIDGESFAECMVGEVGPRRDHLVWDCTDYAVQRAVRTDTHLYIRTYHPGEYEHLDPVALYDMRTDPYQTTNIAEANPDLVKHAEKLLATWEQEQKAKPTAMPDPLMEVVASRQG